MYMNQSESTLANLAAAYAERDEWDQAIEAYQNILQSMEQAGDLGGLARTCVNLGSVYFRKEEWDRAIEYYQKAVLLWQHLDDSYGLAATWSNLGLLYLRTGQAEEARPFLARAFLLFDQLGLPDAANIARALIQACGSVEAANAYLAQVQQAESAQGAAAAQEQDFSLEQLLADVARACRGDTALAQRLFRLTRHIGSDPNVPGSVRNLGLVLTLILSGERRPDLSGLPEEIAGAVQGMLDAL